MLNLSRSERFLILALLIIGLFCAGISYYYKINNTTLEAIDNIRAHPLIDINNASAAELERLPGIGPVLAHDIILYRDSVSGFRSIEELKDVKGIGSKKFERIKGLVTIDE